MAANSTPTPRPSMDEEHCAAERAQLDPLVGGVITCILDGGESFGFRVTSRGVTYDVWVDCDPEGNGPGHLNVEPSDRRRDRRG